MRQEPVLLDETTKNKEEDFDTLVSKFTDFNNNLFTHLKDLPSDKKEKVLEIIRNNAHLSGTLRRIPKWTLQNPENENTDRFAKLKNLMVPLILKADPSTYLEKGKTNYYSLKRAAGLKLESVNSDNMILILDKVTKIVTKPIQNIQILHKRIIDKKNQIQDKFLFIGEKKLTEKIKKKFTEQLNLIGFEATDILHTQPKDVFLTQKEIDINIANSLDKKYSIKYENSEISIELMKDLSDELKLEFLQKVMWPKVKSELTKNIDFTMNITEIKKTNKFIKRLTDFSVKNNLNADVVIHMLKNKPELLEDKKASYKVFEIKDDLLKNMDKYEKMMNATVMSMKSLIDITDKIQESVSNLKVSDEKKKEFIDQFKSETLYANKMTKKTFTYDQIKRNVVSVLGDVKKSLSSEVIPEKVESEVIAEVAPESNKKSFSP